jgi:hypothetical protein
LELPAIPVQEQPATLVLEQQEILALAEPMFPRHRWYCSLVQPLQAFLPAAALPNRKRHKLLKLSPKLDIITKRRPAMAAFLLCPVNSPLALVHM